MNTRTVGLIGLGNIGGGMCMRLLERGYQVIGFDVSAEAKQRAAAGGATIAESPQDVARKVSVILSSLPNPSIVRDVFIGDAGAVAAAAPGTVIIETSTIDPISIRHLAEVAAAQQVHVLDVALSGEPPQAAKGELVFQVGGPDELVEQHLTLLEALAKKINRTGGIGTAKTVKLVNNLMSLGNIAVAAEAFVLGVKCGMDPARLFEILSVSGGRSAHFNYDFPRVLEDDYTPGFKTSLALKDINLILDLAEAEDYQSVLAPVIASLYQRAVDNGSGDEHFTSVVKLYQEAARAADSQST
jgi:3-hydroxyisobutyrate dehydrogenase